MTEEATTAVMRGVPRGAGQPGGGGISSLGAAQNFGVKRDVLEEDATRSLLNMTAGATSSQQIEEAVAVFDTLDMAKIEESVLEEAFSKIKAKLSEQHKKNTDRSRRGNDDSFTRHPNHKISPNTSQRRRYQATVEDDIDESPSSDKDTPRPVKDPRPELHLDTRTSSSRSSSPSSTASASSTTPCISLDTVSPIVTPPRSDVAEVSPKPSRPRVRFSDRSPPIVVNGRDEMRAAVRTSGLLPEKTGDEVIMSAVDLKWGILFEKGEPTKRLQQILRGLASYLINECSPRNSMVITPGKLFAFYDRYCVDVEWILFGPMFANRTKSLACLTRLYEDLHCEFHLVQEHPGATPDIPALTPAGFVQWTTMLIQTFPDEEADRLNKVFADLPIEAEGLAVDGKTERVPKQLSRHIFPAQPVEKGFFNLAGAVLIWRNSMGIGDSVPTSPTWTSSAREARPDPRPDLSRTVSDRGGEIEVSRRRSEASYRGYNRKPASRTEEPSSRRYSARHNSRAHHQQQQNSTVSGSRHARQRPRSPHSSGGSRYRRETPRTTESSSTGGGGGNYRVSSTAEAGELQRRSREEEYRFAQGRDRWGGVESTPRVGGGLGSGSLGGTSRRRSLVISPSKDDNPTYEEYLAEKGGGYGL